MKKYRDVDFKNKNKHFFLIPIFLIVITKMLNIENYRYNIRNRDNFL